MGIPDWTSAGVIPPVRSDESTGHDRSPYLVSLVDVVLRFGDSPERLEILDGLLRLRAALHSAGFVCGFQWLDGSFLEHVELTESRTPRDIDVVTFVESTERVILTAENVWIAEHHLVKSKCLVDHYFVEMDRLPGHLLVARAAYWYSMWSHRRSQFWKGFLQIDLASTDDATAEAVLMNSREVVEQS